MINNRYNAYGYCFRVERDGTAYKAVGRTAGRGVYVLDRLGVADTEAKMQAILDAWARRNNIRPIRNKEVQQGGGLVQGVLLK